MPDDGGARGGALEKEPPVIHGAGEYQYQIANDWPKVPPGMQWREVGSVAVDDNDQVYVFNRGPHPMMVFDREGTFSVLGVRGCFHARTARISPPMGCFT